MGRGGRRLEPEQFIGSDKLSVWGVESNSITNHRPNWKRLIEDVEQGKIGTVIVKDMSRVGRDYLQMGFYTEVLFREKGVHFIAISNGVDSEKRESAEFAPEP